MGGLALSLSDPQVITVWEKVLDREIRAHDPLLDPAAGLAGKGMNSLVQHRDALTNGGGTLRIKFRYQLEGRGRQGDEVLKGNEEGYKSTTMDLSVDTIRHAFNVTSPIQQQWVSEDTLAEGRDGLADWAASRLSFALHAHAAGISSITDDAFALHNTINAINTTNTSYILRPNGKTTDEDLDSNDEFDIDQLNRLAQRVTMVRPKIRPAQTPWGPKYCMFISPAQRASLKKSDSQWYGAMSAALQGGDKKSGVFTRALGSFDDFLLFVSDFVPPGINSSSGNIIANTNRAWVGGAGALTLCFGRGWMVAPGYTPNRWEWVKESEDYNHQQAIAVKSIVGASRLRFQKPGESHYRENGVLVLSTYGDLDGVASADAYKPWTDAGLTIA